MVNDEVDFSKSSGEKRKVTEGGYLPWEKFGSHVKKEKLKKGVRSFFSTVKSTWSEGKEAVKSDFDKNFPAEKRKSIASGFNRLMVDLAGKPSKKARRSVSDPAGFLFGSKRGFGRKQLKKSKAFGNAASFDSGFDSGLGSIFLDDEKPRRKGRQRGMSMDDWF
jgi:hypothetical protein